MIKKSKSIFEDNMLYKEFEAELLSWIGTPYKHFTMVKHRGADCALFVMGCLKEIGVLSYVNTKDYYSRDWWRHGGGEFIKDQFVKHMKEHALENYTSIWIPKSSNWRLVRGDLLAFSMSKTGISHHCGILLHGKKEMIHSVIHRGVEKTNYAPWWERHRTGAIRVIRRKVK